ncbi:zinc knuckle family expressed [Hordeum vulgare]|nr:zinc knuckle family expressed [Hordeum vulgare]
MDPNLERIVDMEFSPPKDSQSISLEDDKNSYLNAQASNVLFDALSNVVIFQLMPFRDAHEPWTKLQDKYGVSKICGNDCSPSTSSRVVFSTSSTSPTCGLPQEQDVALNDASRDPTSSSIVTHFCLMAKASKLSPTLNPNISLDDDDDNDNEDDDNDEKSDNIASLKFKGEMIFKSLDKNKLACSNFMEIMSLVTEGKKYTQELEAHLKEHEATIETMEATKEYLEETFAVELSRLKESHDRALEVANDFRTKNDKLEGAHSKLLEDYEHLENGSRAIKSSLIELIESYAQLEASYAKELVKLPSPLVVNDDACATNSISCEASILKENVELRAQLELLCSNYVKLKESHVMLTSSHDDLLVSHNVLKLVNEASTTQEIEELKAQVTSLKKDLEKSHEGMYTLNNTLCGQKSPNDKGGLGFNSNKKKKSKSFNKKGQEQLKNSAKIVCFKCKIQGHHVRSFRLKNKPQSHNQQRKRPQVQSRTQLQVKEMPLPKKTQANAP